MNFENYLQESSSELLTKVKTYDKKMLIDIAKKLGDSPEEMDILGAVLTVLETQMTEKDFIALCDTL
jgi:predicted ATP-grasp superfamily ATP-dependent carboligase